MFFSFNSFVSSSYLKQIESNDESFWDQFWSDKVSSVQDIFALIPAAEIRALREELPSNLATLCNKLVDRIQSAAEHSCQTQRDQTAGLQKRFLKKDFYSLSFYSD